MVDVQSEDLGKRLMQERKMRHWTQAQLADKSGVSESSIRRWENGRASPRPTELANLIKVFGKSPDQWGNTNPRWNNAPFHNPYFTGREQVLERLHEALAARQAVALSQAKALSGLAGLGKTQTAIEYAYRYAHEYEAVLWVRADPETLDSDFANLAVVLELPEQKEPNQQDVVFAVKRWLNSHNSWLLIFDNADNPALVTNFLPGQSKGAVLLTTRAQAIGPHKKIELEKMSCEEGVDFLLRRIHPDEEQKPYPAGIDPLEQEEAGQL